jgi:pimeloyl-ACP methyl ester carboxylesterase
MLYRNEMKALAVKQSRESQVIVTSQGELEYAAVGEGRAMLISHSASGGYDQGLATARRFPGFKVIAPSRGGYLRTPRDTGLTPGTMAAAYANLLDVLAVERVVVVGWSAGGMSAIEFALAYPERCSGLILGGAVTKSLPEAALTVLRYLGLFNYSDFLSWLISKISTQVIIPFTEHDPATRAVLNAFAAANPAGKRRIGYDLDLGHMKDFCPPLARILVPTLILHGSDDPIVPLSHAREAANRIPDAQLVVIEGGQHDSPVRNTSGVRPAVDAFLAKVFNT